MRKTVTNQEIRCTAGNIELRDATEESEHLIEGYALKFDTWSENLGGFKETITRKALENTDFSDVRALFNHNADHVLARSSAGTLHLDVDDIGLKFRFQVPETTYGKDLLENIRNGNVSQCSFGFQIAKDGDAIEYDNEDKIYKRQLNDIERIVDISAVTYPAYQDTEVGPALRSIDAINELEQRQRELDKLKLRINLL